MKGTRQQVSHLKTLKLEPHDWVPNNPAYRSSFESMSFVRDA